MSFFIWFIHLEISHLSNHIVIKSKYIVIRIYLYVKHNILKQMLSFNHVTEIPTHGGRIDNYRKWPVIQDSNF